MPYQLTDINIIKSDLEIKLGKEELEKAVEAYNKRDRRFGGLTENAR